MLMIRLAFSSRDFPEEFPNANIVREQIKYVFVYGYACNITFPDVRERHFPTPRPNPDETFNVL